MKVFPNELIKDRAPAYRRELEQFGGALAGGARGILEDP